MEKKQSKDDPIFSQVGKAIYSEIRKSLRSYESVRSSSSPRSTSLHRRPDLLRFGSLHLLKLYEESMLKFGGSKLVSLKWFLLYPLTSDGSKSYLFRQQAFNFYTSAFDGSHSYLFEQQKNRIDWMKMGAFFHASLASFPRVPVEEVFMTIDFCILNHTKTVIWVAALKLVGYSLYKLDTYEGTIQTQDARQAELYFSQICKNGSWDYKVIDQMHPKDRTNSDFIHIWALVAPPAGVPRYLPAESAPSCPKPQACRRQRDEDEENRPRKKTKGAEYLPHPYYRCAGCDSDIVPIHWVEEVENFQNHDPRTLLRWIFPRGETIEFGSDSNIVARGIHSFIVYDVKCHKCKLLLGFQQVSFALLAGYLTVRKRIGLCYFYRSQLD